MRADAKEMIQAQHAVVVSSEERALKAEQELEGRHGLLKELKTALEATLVDNAKCKAEVAQLAELKLALESCRCSPHKRASTALKNARPNVIACTRVSCLQKFSGAWHPLITP